MKKILKQAGKLLKSLTILTIATITILLAACQEKPPVSCPEGQDLINGECHKKPEPPVTLVDTVVKWNFPNSVHNQAGKAGFPTYFQVKEIKNSPKTGNVYLELDEFDQSLTHPGRVKDLGDSLKIMIKEGFVTVKLKNKNGGKDTIIVDRMPVQEAIDNWGEMGYAFKLATKSAQKAKGTAAQTYFPKKIEFGTRAEKIQYAADRRENNL